MNKRLKEIRMDTDLTQEEFALRLGFNSKGHISALESGTREINERTIKQICLEFNVNENWFRTGEGEMYNTTETFSLDEEVRKKGLSDFAVEVVKSFVSMPKEIQEPLLEYMKKYFSKFDENELAATSEKHNNIVPYDELKENHIYKYETRLLGTTAGGYPLLAIPDDCPRSIKTNIKCDYALFLKGASMEPDYPNSSIILISKSFDFHDGDVYIVEIDVAAEIAETTCKKVYKKDDAIELVPINKDYNAKTYPTSSVRITGKVIGIMKQ